MNNVCTIVRTVGKGALVALGLACDQPPVHGESLAERAERVYVARRSFPPTYPRNGRWIQIVEERAFSIWVDSVTLADAGTADPSGWLLWSYTRPRTELERPYSTERQRFEAHCEPRTLLMGEFVAYTDSGGAIAARGDGELVPSAVIPESAGEAILRQLCTGISGW